MAEQNDDREGLKDFDSFKDTTLRDIEYLYRKFENGDCDPNISETNALNNCLDEIEKVKNKIKLIYDKHIG